MVRGSWFVVRGTEKMAVANSDDQQQLVVTSNRKRTRLRLRRATATEDEGDEFRRLGGDPHKIKAHLLTLLR